MEARRKNPLQRIVRAETKKENKYSIRTVIIKCVKIHLTRMFSCDENMFFETKIRE